MEFDEPLQVVLSLGQVVALGAAVDPRQLLGGVLLVHGDGVLGGLVQARVGQGLLDHLDGGFVALLRHVQMLGGGVVGDARGAVHQVVAAGGEEPQRGLDEGVVRGSVVAGLPVVPDRVLVLLASVGLVRLAEGPHGLEHVHIVAQPLRQTGDGGAAGQDGDDHRADDGTLDEFGHGRFLLVSSTVVSVGPRATRGRSRRARRRSPWPHRGWRPLPRRSVSRRPSGRSSCRRGSRRCRGSGAEVPRARPPAC